ncbi:hypothetical protein V9T40_012646 [Parthenolecanium corni]|uniref:GBD/FH3 domain-containing protein n=1 Tax=Parthenolecanium corni TaxID=536013 RepID=A0AAN9Y0M7_9HEMI
MISKPSPDSSPTIRKLSSGNGSSSAGSWRSQDSNSSKSREFSRPPIYNPEDYAVSLKKWIGKVSQKVPDQADVTAQTVSNEGEMSLRQFLSISDLLNKLKTDLRLAYLSFVQEFVSDPIDGITLILELLRSIQLNDSNQQIKVTPANHRRALLDENSCLQCLQYCLRCEETTRRLAMSSAGLFTLAVCIMSSVSKSRILALELLSEICRYSHTSGHNAVSEAISTMRLRFGEPVRFRFLVSMLNGASTDLLLAGLQFINTFLETSPNKQIQLYIQAELEQAGLNCETFKKILSVKENQDELVLDEFNRWSKLYINIEVLTNDFEYKCKEVSALKGRIAQLEAEMRLLQNEKETLTARENSFKERFNDLEYRLAVSRTNSTTKSFALNGDVAKRGCPGVGGGGNSTPAEDEGISSSDQDDSDEMAAPSNKFTNYEHYPQPDVVCRPYSEKISPSEPTIDEVMEDFQNIINDVQNQNYQQNQSYQQAINGRHRTSKSSAESLSEALILDKESDIVPTKILPEPPKKSRSLHFLGNNLNGNAVDSKIVETNPFFEDESLANSNFSCISRCCSFEQPEIQTPKSSRFSHSYEAIEDVLPKSPPAARLNGSNVARSNLRRSETFHHLQIDTSSAHRGVQKSRLVEKVAAKGTCDRQQKTPKTNCISNGTGKNSRSHASLQNNDNAEKELKRSVSTKPVKGAQPFPKIPNSYFSKTNFFPVNAQPFNLKRHNNAGLYSGKNHGPANSTHLHQVITITSEYPKRSLNGLKQINLNICDGKIMDLPSGLY